jgi:type I restriction enzyme S subunit
MEAEPTDAGWVSERAGVFEPSAISGWETKRFDEFGTIYSGSTPSTAIRSFWDGDIVWITPYDLSRIKTPYLHESAKRIAAVPPELDGSNITQDTARLRLDDQCSTQFFYFLLQSKAIQDQVLLHSVGQAVKGINISEVKRISFGLPTKHEQKEIGQRLEKLESSLDISRRQVSKLQSLKSSLMQDLLTGRKRVTELLGETAAA